MQVYLTAGAVYGLEGTLGDLEQCARSISSGTTDTELAFLEDQVAAAAAHVQQSELQVRLRPPFMNNPQELWLLMLPHFQVSNIEARIFALKTAGLNVATCNRFSKFRTKAQVSLCTHNLHAHHPCSAVVHSLSPGTDERHVAPNGARARADYSVRRIKPTGV